MPLFTLWILKLQSGSDDLQLDLGFPTFLVVHLRFMWILTSGYICNDLTFCLLSKPSKIAD